MNAARTGSRDFINCTRSEFSSDTDDECMDVRDKFPVDEVGHIRWLELMTTSFNGQTCREQAGDIAEDYWMLQRKARIHEAHENLQAARRKLAARTDLKSGARKGPRDARSAHELRRAHELRLCEQDAILELSSLKSVLASEVLGEIATGKAAAWFREEWLYEEGLSRLRAQEYRTSVWFDDWVKELNWLTPALFLQIVTTLALEDGQPRLHMFMESLSLDLCWFGATRRLESLFGSAALGDAAGDALSEWDPTMRCDLSSFRILFCENDEMQEQEIHDCVDQLSRNRVKFPDRTATDGHDIFLAFLTDAARRLSGGGGVFRSTYSITPAVKLLHPTDEDLALMLKVLVDAGQESRCFTTVLSKALLNEALQRTTVARAMDWFVDMAYLVILLHMACAVNTDHKPAKVVQISFFCVSFWVVFSFIRKMGGGLSLFSSSTDGFVAGLLKHTKLWNIVMSFTELFSTYFAYRFLVYVIWDTGEGAWTLFRLHPGFLSFLVLVRWTQLAIGLLQIEQLGRNVVPVVHAITRPESLSFLFFLFIVVVGSFHAYYVFPIQENTGTFSHIMRHVLRMGSIVGMDFSLSELEGLGDEFHGTFLTNHSVEGEMEPEAADNEFHKSLRAEFVVLSLVVNVVFLNVYIGLLGELYGRAVQRKSQLYNHYLASYAYRNLARWCRLSCETCRGEEFETGVVWVAYNRANLLEESEEKSVS
ncbi:hypothetical protein AK812_SmicGene20758 [Symbiodinium microadriaticum]|uniref:Ion transport domain-containing protein n=2 Tax=Symbiodinium TaxID=2949 RepID=A0A1Q9DP62_SYMMI|nr:hypothetical protein AK812_SmicGene20758 [Symbiodinium microadriaticum]